MGRIKKPKKVKLPKPAIKEKETREQKKSKRAIKKAKKAREKKINRTLGIVAIVLCFISSVLDVLIKLTNNKKDL